MIQIKICILQEVSNHEQLKSIIISRDSIISNSKLKAVRLQVQYFFFFHFKTIFANIENPVMEKIKSSCDIFNTTAAIFRPTCNWSLLVRMDYFPISI